MNIEKPEQCISYLKTNGLIRGKSEVTCRPLPGGVSSRTVLVEPHGQASFVLKQALDKLRVPVDWFSGPERVHREALGLRWMAEVAPAGSAPKLLYEDHDAHIIAMSAIATPHANFKELLLAGHISLEHVQQFGHLLGTIHYNGYIRRAETAVVFADQHFFESLRLEPYYGFAGEQVADAFSFLSDLRQETAERKITVVHGDYSPKNVLLYKDNVVLLDYEVIHFGDPAFDLGFALTHFLSKAHHLPTLRQTFYHAAQIFWQTYWSLIQPLPWAIAAEEYAVRHTLACLLARVDGRSPLEYLTESERSRQRQAVIAIMKNPPLKIMSLIDEFIHTLD